MNTNGNITCLLTLFLLVLMVPPATAQSTSGEFNSMIDRFKSGEIFRGEFVHRYVDSYTQDTVVSRGQLWVGRDRYKVVSNRKTIVVDQMISRVYDQDRGRVIISRYDPEEDDFAPSRFLNGTDSTYTVSSTEIRDGNTVIQLESKDAFALFNEVRITISADLIPRDIFAVDQAENRITTTFANGRFIGFRDGMFELNYPDTTEIIDMRN